MMRKLFQLGIISASHQNINKPGPNARLFRITKPIPMAPSTPKDVYLMKKFNSLTPDAAEMNFPSKAIGHIEAALKNISDLVHENEIHKEYSNALQNKRTKNSKNSDCKLCFQLKILYFHEFLLFFLDSNGLVQSR